MPFPETFDELKAAGYRFENDSECKGCGDPIEWWVTPNNRTIPMNPMTKGKSPAIPHWSTCVESDSFRK